MNFVLHIAAKDLTALRPQGAILVLLQFAYTAFSFQPQQPGTHSLPTNLGWLVLLLAHAWFIGTAVHAEPIAGNRQYWLTRPISRRHLFAAKLLVVLAVIHVPLLFSDCIILIGHQFSPFPYLPGLLWRQMLYLLTVTLPILAIAAATANFAQFAAAILLTAVAVLWLPVMLSNSLRDVYWGGLYWIKFQIMNVLAAATGVLILVLLYGYRRVGLSRALVAVGALLIPATYALFPFPVAFAIQRSLASTAPFESKVVFDSDAQQGLQNVSRRPSFVQTAITIPYRFDPPLSSPDLYLDHAEGVVRSAPGATTRVKTQTPFPLDPEAKGHFLHLTIDRAWFNRHRAEPSTIELTLFFTSFHPGQKHTMPVQTRGQLILGLGWCRPHAEPGMVFINCSTPLHMVPRATMQLVHPVTGGRTIRDMRMGEAVNYSPLPTDRFTFQPIGIATNFFSTMNLPGDNLMQKDFRLLLNSNAEFTVRAPKGHFTVSLTVPPTPLEDFLR